MPRSAIDRFLAKVDASGDCWEWTGGLNGGYGMFRDEGRQGRAHRWLWTYLVGPIAPGLVMDHLCRNHRCVNPDHLELVTPQENRRRSPFYRNVSCVRGHPWTADTTIWHRDPRWGPARTCKTCRNLLRRLPGSITPLSDPPQTLLGIVMDSGTFPGRQTVSDSPPPLSATRPL